MKRFLFSQLSRDFQIQKCTIPQCVSVTKNPDDETCEMVEERQAKFLSLPEEIRDKLVSDETRKVIEEIGKLFGLDLMQMSDIARAIRSFYFGELTLNKISENFVSEMNIDVRKANEIVKAIEEKIIITQPSASKYEKIVLTMALKKYDKLGEQHLSGSPIKLKIFEAPVRPSIKNWIADYHEKLDAQKHDSIERGNYLFHSENGRKLTSGERQKVGTMLRALDEDSLVTVDPQRQEMLFQSEMVASNQNPAANSTPSRPAPQNIRPAQSNQAGAGMNFSSTHKFPFEQNASRPAVAPRQNQRANNNVVDLKNV